MGGRETREVTAIVAKVRFNAVLEQIVAMEGKEGGQISEVNCLTPLEYRKKTLKFLIIFISYSSPLKPQGVVYVL